MREILFRGKDSHDGKWVKGFYTPISTGHGMEDAVITGTDRNCSIPVLVITETLGQYTGLTDKNGTRIFEGDIIKQDSAYKTIISCVQICKEPLSKLYGVCKKFRDGSGTAMLRVDVDYEVIGNIFDNPELLRGDTE